ncbi:MAG: hypothetical protein H7319_03440 [Spirosoma sp.]|nr:hypothetical protein [Spirosoma sp.]
MKKSSVVFAVRVAFVLLTTSLSAFAQEQEGSNLRVIFTTGSDDLRSNAWVFLKITRTDGSAMEEIPLGSGFTQ